MTQNITWGGLYWPRGNLYGGVAPYLAEASSTTDGTNPGFGARQGARAYAVDASQLNSTGVSGRTQGWVDAFKAGTDLYLSVSNQTISGFTYAAAVTSGSVKTANDAAFMTFINVIKTLPFSQPVAAGSPYGGYTRPKLRFTLQHECDQPSKSVYGTPAQYIAYVRYIDQMFRTNNVRQYIDYSLCITEYGISQNRVDQYFAGFDVIDSLGIDPYWDFTGSWTFDGSTTPAATALANTLAWVRKYKLPFCFPELSIAESGNDTAMQQWYTDFATTLNNATDVTCTGVFLWSQSGGAGAYENYNKLASQDPATGKAHAGKHAGILAAMNATGGNAILGAPGTGPTSRPSPPTGVTVTPSADGTSCTITWAAPLAGDQVQGARAYIAPGITTTLHKDDTSDLPVSPTSYTFAGLTPGGTVYSCAVTWFNAIGNSGYSTDSNGNIINFATATPATQNNAPNIASATATQDPSNPNQILLAAVASDPQSQALTYSWKLTSPTGNVRTASGASATVTNITEFGTWQVTLAVTNTTPLTTNWNGTVPMAAPVSNQLATAKFGWPKPQPGGLSAIRKLGPIIRGFMDAVDGQNYNTLYAKSPQNALHGFLGSTYDIAACAGATDQTLTSGWAYWSSFVLQDDHFSEIWFLLDQLQIGTGTQLAIYDGGGQILADGVYTNTTAGADSRTVDQAFQAVYAATATGMYALPNPVRGRTPGETFYIHVYNTGATQAAKLRVCPAGGSIGKVGPLTATQPRVGGYNLGTGQTLPNQLNFGAWTNQAGIWFGVS